MSGRTEYRNIWTNTRNPLRSNQRDKGWFSKVEFLTRSIPIDLKWVGVALAFHLVFWKAMSNRPRKYYSHHISQMPCSSCWRNWFLKSSIVNRKSTIWRGSSCMTSRCNLDGVILKLISGALSRRFLQRRTQSINFSKAPSFKTRDNQFHFGSNSIDLLVIACFSFVKNATFS